MRSDWGSNIHSSRCSLLSVGAAEGKGAEDEELAAFEVRARSSLLGIVVATG